MSIKTHKKEDLMQEAEENKSVVTSCDGCVFGCEQDIENENLEDYCAVGRLSKFKDSGAEIFSVQSKQKNKNFKFIKDNICNMLRGKPWDEIKIKRGHKEEDLPAVAREEIKIQCAFIIYVTDDVQTKEEEDEKRKRQLAKNKIELVAKTVKSAEDGLIKPQNIIIVNNSEIGPYDFINYLRRSISDLKISSKWSMEHISDDTIKNLDDKEEAMHRCIDIAAKSVASIHYAVFMGGDIVPNNYLSDIDIAINDRLEKFLILKPDDGSKSGLFIQKLAYKQFGGNRQQEYISKIEDEAKEQGCPHLVQKLSNVVASQ